MRLNVIWDCIAGGCCIFPFVPLVLCSQVSQPVWWAYYSTTLPERPCQFRSSPAMLKDAPLPHFCHHSVWVQFINLTHLYDFALISVSLVIIRSSVIWFYLLKPLFLQIVWSCLLFIFTLSLGLFTGAPYYAILFLFKSLMLFSPGNSLSGHSVCPIHL